MKSSQRVIQENSILAELLKLICTGKREVNWIEEYGYPVELRNLKQKFEAKWKWSYRKSWKWRESSILIVIAENEIKSIWKVGNSEQKGRNLNIWYKRIKL